MMPNTVSLCIRQLCERWPKAWVIAFCLLAYSGATAQEIVSTLRLGRKEPKPIWFEYSPLDEGLVTVGQMQQKSKRQIGLFKYDAQFKRQWQVALFEQGPNKLVDQLVVLGDLILVFVSEYRPREDRISIQLYQYSLEGKLLTNGQEVMASVNEKKHRNLLRFEKSLDKNKLMVMGQLHNDARRIVDEDEYAREYDYLLFDIKNDTVRKGQIHVDENSVFRLKEMRVSSAGNVFLLGKQDLQLQGGKEATRFVLFKLDILADRLIEIPLNFGANFVADLTCKPDLQENLVITGFYSNRPGAELSGILFAKLEAVSNYVSIISYDPFSPQLLARYLSAREVARGRELADFFLDQMVQRADGGVMLLAEQYYVTTSGWRDAYGFYNTRTTYNYNDVLVFAISPQGKIEWTSIVQKQQQSPTPDELSYALMVGPEDLFVFYKHTYPGTGTNIYYHTVNGAGQVSTPKAFFPNFQQNYTFYRRQCEQINNDEGLMVYYQPNSKTFALARVQF